uniref:Uncharacterized protein n=1 Tax=Zea mays TaxID=4577 RepID=B7ZZ82_MAIZE|nr:unknown [Zea mays]
MHSNPRRTFYSKRFQFNGGSIQNLGVADRRYPCPFQRAEC